MITAGPTYEKIDPVRFIGNYSSGKMGFAIADECAARGAKVIMVSGPVQQQLKYPANWFAVESLSLIHIWKRRSVLAHGKLILSI